jgi:hypothetical protein
VNVPFGTHSLFIACSDDKQFSGILKLLKELGRLSASHLLNWRGIATDLSRRRVLQRVIISGHGSPTQTGFEVDSDQVLTPVDLLLPGSTYLYLMSCYQGREKQRLAWAAGSGVRANRVRGSSGETESALSTCLLLHLLEDGVDSIDRWFLEWRRCNDAFRPYFPEIRDVYAQAGADPLAALGRLKEAGRLDVLFRIFEEFLGIIYRRPSYLTDLA